MISEASNLGNITIMNTRLEHGEGMHDSIRSAYEVEEGKPCNQCVTVENLRHQLERFPEGQFVAIYTGGKDPLVVGMASTMRTSYPPTDPPQRWLDAIGDLNISKHDPEGEWLYGVEMSVRHEFKRRGIGRALYQARFDLTRRLNLRGWYVGGMLMGYCNYRDQMTPLEYGEKVIAGEIYDPTVSMQINSGFEPRQVMLDYLKEPDANDTGVLLVWENPDYRNSKS